MVMLQVGRIRPVADSPLSSLLNGKEAKGTIAFSRRCLALSELGTDPAWCSSARRPFERPRAWDSCHLQGVVTSSLPKVERLPIDRSSASTAPECRCHRLRPVDHPCPSPLPHGYLAVAEKWAQAAEQQLVTADAVVDAVAAADADAADAAAVVLAAELGAVAAGVVLVGPGAELVGEPAVAPAAAPAAEPEAGEFVIAAAKTAAASVPVVAVAAAVPAVAAVPAAAVEPAAGSGTGVRDEAVPVDAGAGPAAESAAVPGAPGASDVSGEKHELPGALVGAEHRQDDEAADGAAEPVAAGDAGPAEPVAVVRPAAAEPAEPVVDGAAAAAAAAAARAPDGRPMPAETGVAAGAAGGVADGAGERG
ncbi:hypothetical protein GGI35DRAFT_6364 [Trichoderma velutinum]